MGYDEVVNQLRNQRPGQSAVLISLERVLSTAFKHGLTWVQPSLAKLVDTQNVPLAEYVVCSTQLQAALLVEGHVREALMLRLIGHAHQAWDQPGFNFRARTNRLQRYALVLRHLLQPQLDSLWDCASLGSRSIRVAGFTMELFFMDMLNVEARLWLVSMRPALAHILVERSLSTDDVENEFSIIVNGLGSTIVAIASYLKRVDYLAWVRRHGHEMGLAVPHLQASAYALHAAMRLGDMAWHNGAALLDPNLMLTYEGRLMNKVYNNLGLKRPTAIRDYFANKGA